MREDIGLHVEVWSDTGDLQNAEVEETRINARLADLQEIGFFEQAETSSARVWHLAPICKLSELMLLNPEQERQLSEGKMPIHRDFPLRGEASEV